MTRRARSVNRSNTAAAYVRGRKVSRFRRSTGSLVSDMDAIESLGLPESRWVDVAGGPVHYREWGGPAEGPTFVLVHGLGGSLLNWAQVAPGLAAWGRVVALDLAGFGLTPLGDRSADVRSNRRLLGGFIETMGLAPVILVGNSM